MKDHLLFSRWNFAKIEVQINFLLNVCFAATWPTGWSRRKQGCCCPCRWAVAAGGRRNSLSETNEERK
jgi:hypothetical protein